MPDSTATLTPEEINFGTAGRKFEACLELRLAGGRIYMELGAVDSGGCLANDMQMPASQVTAVRFT